MVSQVIKSGRCERSADTAIEAGVGGLVYLRVKAGGDLDAAKATLEGLSSQARTEIVHACQAEEVSSFCERSESLGTEQTDHKLTRHQALRLDIA